MISLTMNETMSGFIELNETGKQEPFEFTISVFFENRMNPLLPQPFKGTFTLADRNISGPVSGEITLKVTGPRYELDLDFPGIGLVHLAGEKTYTLSELTYSLTTCPLTLYRAGKPIGFAEVAYREPLLSFPFKAFRLARAESVLGG